MGILDGARAALEVVKKVNDAEIKADLIDRILGLQEQIGNLHAELSELRAENANLKQQLSDKSDVEEFKATADLVMGGVYVRKDDKCQPYCGGCVADQSKVVALANLNSGQWKCPVCEAIFRYRPL